MPVFAIWAALADQPQLAVIIYRKGSHSQTRSRPCGTQGSGHLSPLTGSGLAQPHTFSHEGTGHRAQGTGHRAQGTGHKINEQNSSIYQVKTELSQK